MKRKMKQLAMKLVCGEGKLRQYAGAALCAALIAAGGGAQAQTSKPNILFIVSDDTGQTFQWVREQLEKEGISLPLPTGN